MSTSNSSCKDGASKSNDDGICEAVGSKLQKLSTADISVCANCGKEGDNVNNICNKCKQVKYCNAACKKKHRHKHKKECERRVAELHDEELFKQPPPEEDCPICFLLMPTLGSTGCRYQTCCGKIICSGCIHAPVFDNQGNEVDNEKCPFCRTPEPKSEKEFNQRRMKRVDLDDPIAMYNVGCDYRDGSTGHPQDYTKALELFYRSGELGCAIAYLNIGYAYNHGKGVKVDKKKAIHYYELAAMGGNVSARYNLGLEEQDAGNMNRALKHHTIAARNGLSESLEVIKELYTNGHATKDDYTKALRLYQAYLSEIKSDQRDKAAAFDSDDYRYY